MLAADVHVPQRVVTETVYNLFAAEITSLFVVGRDGAGRLVAHREVPPPR